VSSALANATAQLDDDVKAAVPEREDELLHDATRLTPEEFGKNCRELARLLEGDNGLACNDRQRRDTVLTRTINRSTGMIEGRYAFHPELANQVFRTIDEEVAALIAEGTRRGATGRPHRADFVDGDR